MPIPLLRPSRQRYPAGMQVGQLGLVFINAWNGIKISHFTLFVKGNKPAYLDGPLRV
jgi:hypothetical protein